ncbi:isoprenyl transferase [Brotonthovivens ammoniilytica]|uniref:isoprenyl transferase n=1 Tax=Brotonthovivens ammoniilytica TaxID=2981725 RepID=UPI003A83ADBF
MKIPRHISIILDGNGRWAKGKGMPRTYGHTVGAKNIEQICMDADAIGIKYLTVYAFSTENWNRPSSEVAALMKLLNFYLRTIGKKAMKNNMRMRIIGDRPGLPEDIRQAVDSIEALTRENTGLQFQIAINYGSRDEMIRAMKKMLADYEQGQFLLEELDSDKFSSYLDTADIPDPDLMIRTSGEERLSNYLMWQHAYSEFYFTKTPWPDFKKEDLIEAIRVYTSRDRRYGAIKEES